MNTGIHTKRIIEEEKKYLKFIISRRKEEIEKCKSMIEEHPLLREWVAKLLDEINDKINRLENL